MPAIFDGRQPRGLWARFMAAPGGLESNNLEIISTTRGGLVVESIVVRPDGQQWQCNIGIPQTPTLFQEFGTGGTTGAVPIGGLKVSALWSQWNGPPGGFTGYNGAQLFSGDALRDVEIYVPTGSVLRLNGLLGVQMQYHVVFRELVSIDEDRSRITYVRPA